MKTIELRIPKTFPKTFAVKSNLTKKNFCTFQHFYIMTKQLNSKCFFQNVHEKLFARRFFNLSKHFSLSTSMYISNKTKDIAITGDKILATVETSIYLIQT